jgi:uncharacterized protein YmfQ (DUF2313 family)
VGLTVSIASFVQQLQALLPRGLLWSRDPDSLVTKTLEGIAPEFCRVQTRANDLLLEMSPATAVEMLDEYEATQGLPDPCTAAPTLPEDRQAALLARLREDAGHNPADYVALAETFSHAGSVVTRRPFPPFRAGVGRAGEPCYGDGWAHAFTVAYMANLLADPNGFFGWENTATTFDDAAADGPDGTATADRVNFGASVSAEAHTDLPSTQDEAQFDVWLRMESGQGRFTLSMLNVSASVVASKGVDADRRWRRHTVRGEGVATVSIAPETPGSAVSVLAWGAAVGSVDPRFECRMQSTAQSHSVAVFLVKA